MNDPDIERFMLLIPQPYSLADAEEWIQVGAPQMWRSGGAAFALDVGDGVALGGIGIEREERGGIATGKVGYWVAPSARGNGLAARALRLLAPWATAHLGLLYQQLVHDLDNPASCKTALAAGFRTSGIIRGGECYRDGRPRDVERHEWSGLP